MEQQPGYFEKHSEHAFIVQSLAMVVFIILAKDFFRFLIPVVMVVAPVLFVVYIRYKVATTDSSFFDILKEHITFIPVMRSVEERKADKVPWVTYGLILVNVLIFYCIELAMDPQFLSDNLILIPEQPNFWNLPISALTSMFLHSGNGHLWGNMTFLWVVGSAVERRIDSGNYFFLYLFTGLMGGILFLLVEYVVHNSPGHMLGASGAIAGIMGIYAVRCYFKSMIFPVPILGIFFLIFPISLKIRLNSLVVIGIFFYSDLAGGLSQLAGNESNIGHWVHLGGMITGMIVAGLVLNLGDKAIEERHLELGIKAVENYDPTNVGEKSLGIALQQNPDSGEALLGMARLKTRYSATVEGKELFLRAMRLLLSADPKLALQGYQEFMRKYLPTDMEPLLLERLGYAALKLKERATAVNCFTLLATLSDAKAQMRERALFQCGKLLEEMGEFALAHERYALLLQEFPEADVAAKLRVKLESSPVAVPEPEPAMQGIRERIIPVIVQPAVVADSMNCPACSTAMSRRVAKSGSSKGAPFWVCQSYPVCREVIPIDEMGADWVVERN